MDCSNWVDQDEKEGGWGRGKVYPFWCKIQRRRQKQGMSAFDVRRYLFTCLWVQIESSFHSRW